MRIRCDNCNQENEIAFDKLIFDNEDEEVFATYLAAELSKSQSKDDDEQ